ncbi:MAG: hypothetical protein ACLRMZ_10605 [Blautia marasmi]
MYGAVFGTHIVYDCLWGQFRWKDESASENSDEKVHLKVALYSDGQNMSEAQKKVFDSFTEEHPDIVPEFQFITSDTETGTDI